MGAPAPTSCSNCGHNYGGECRLNPPIPVPITSGKLFKSSTEIQQVYPKVTDKDGCSHHLQVDTPVPPQLPDGPCPEAPIEGEGQIAGPCEAAPEPGDRG